MDIVETVAGAELVALTELVVYFGEEVCVVNGVGIKAGGDWRAFVAGVAQAGVDGRDVGFCDGDEAALVQIALFEIGEVKSAIGLERTAQACAVLCLG